MRNSTVTRTAARTATPEEVRSGRVLLNSLELETVVAGNRFLSRISGVWRGAMPHVVVSAGSEQRVLSFSIRSPLVMALDRLQRDANWKLFFDGRQVRNRLSETMDAVCDVTTAGEAMDLAMRLALTSLVQEELETATLMQLAWSEASEREYLVAGHGFKGWAPARVPHVLIKVDVFLCSGMYAAAETLGAIGADRADLFDMLRERAERIVDETVAMIEEKINERYS